jgi:polar amino acid transport system substrate-binding protein
MKIPPFLCALPLLAMAVPALAGCSRPITAPVAASGLSIIIQEQQVSGIYPELLNELGVRAGCRFVYKPVPRARQEAMFETGMADMLFPAPRTARRDQYGTFIPIIQARATVISIDPKHEPIRSLAQLKGTTLRVAVVRGFDYGEAYQQFLRDAGPGGRLFIEADAVAVARLLQAGFADVAVMTPTILAGAIVGDQRLNGMLERLRIEPVEELVWGDTGIYLSKAALNPVDRRVLEQRLGELARSPAVWASYKRYYPADILGASLRAR